jgi:hypothetical protein
VPSAGFQYVDDGRDPCDRQRGETGEHHDWFTHWRNDGHRRSFPRTAGKFEVRAATVSRTAERNRWRERLAAWKGHNSDAIRERFDELAEAGLVPFAQGFARLAAHAVQGDLGKVPPDRALSAATAALRVINEPTVRDLIRISAAAGAGNRELNALGLVLDRLSVEFPDAHDAVLDALDSAVSDTEHTEPGQG